MDEKELIKILSNAATEFGLPSVSASVAADGAEYHAAVGIADAERNLPACPDTIYAIASSTKAFTAAVLCGLAAEGKLCLDERVRTYIPDFRLQDPYAGENITVRDLLCHRSGLPRHDASMLTWEDFRPENITEMVAGLPPVCPLRYAWHYQNHMFVLAGELAARVSGQSYQSLVENRILKPLGMDSTYLYGDEIRADDPRLSAPYDGKAPMLRRLVRDYSAFPAGDGSIYSTTRDMLKWLRFQLHGDESILPEKYLREMQAPQMLIRAVDADKATLPEISSSAYGLGWFVYTYRGKKLVLHGGAVGGYRSMQMFVPETDIAISVLLNSNDPVAREVVGYTVLDRLLGVPSKDGFERFHKLFPATADTSVQIDEPAAEAADLGEYEGNYRNCGYGTLRFYTAPGDTPSGKQLLLPVKALSAQLPMRCSGDDSFSFDAPEYGLSIKVRFVRDSRGRVAAAEIPLEPELAYPIHFDRID